jgi:hypothetical protein
LPFGGGSIESVLARQTLGELPNLRAERGDIPDALVRVLVRGAARDPEDRFPSAEDYAGALERAMRRWRGNPVRILRWMFGGD